MGDSSSTSSSQAACSGPTPSTKPVVTVSVRDLVQFALRTGDLGGEGGFVGRSRALAGTRGHQRLQRSRPEGYQREVAIVGEIDGGDFVLKIQGRIDGILAASDETLLEEIKTVQGHWAGDADPLHWAQVRIYGYLYAREQKLPRVMLRLTYLHLDTGEVVEFTESRQLAELEAFYNQTTATYLEWAQAHRNWCRLRDASARVLAFPFPAYRKGQRELAVAAYKLFGRGGRLFLEAPTGIGKTLSVLFPAVKAMAEGKLERIFYLTARTVGRTVAEQACHDLRTAGLRVRSLTLTAKEKICARQGQPCDITECPLARGYYDRIKAAMRAALAAEHITRPVLEAIAVEHQVCPFELSLEVSSWVDIVICDYNYLFDPQVYLRRHFGEQAGPFAFLVDEAHNLADRAREMFSADLSVFEIGEVKRAVRKAVPGCARALGKVQAELKRLADADAVPEPDQEANYNEPDLFQPLRREPAIRTAEPATPRDLIGTRVLPGLPEDLVEKIESAVNAAEKWLALEEPAEFREALLLLYFRLLTFLRVAEQYDACYVTLADADRRAAVRLFCLDPASRLREALERGKAAIFFSATLTPLDYYVNLLGGSPEDPVLRLTSPFPPERLSLLVQDRIPTQLKVRAASLEQVTESLAAVVEGRAGNYLAYFPSYQYLQDVYNCFSARYSGMRTLVQRPGMSEEERADFLAAFAAEQGETMVAFAVLGGVFGEGIDLAGERLIGAVIVGVGLPQLCLERDLVRDYFDRKGLPGFDYAYTFPGMNRVLQAVGRVIRSEHDRGVALLVDTRFGQARYRRLFPAWWQARRMPDVAAIRRAAHHFWSQP